MLDAPVAPTSEYDLEVLVGNAGFSISTRPGGSNGTPSDGPGARHWRDVLLAESPADAAELGLRGKAAGTYAWNRLASVLEDGICTKVHPGLKTRKARIDAIEKARYATAANVFIAEDKVNAGLPTRARRTRRG